MLDRVVSPVAACRQAGGVAAGSSVRAAQAVTHPAAHSVSSCRSGGVAESACSIVAHQTLRAAGRLEPAPPPPPACHKLAARPQRPSPTSQLPGHPPAAKLRACCPASCCPARPSAASWLRSSAPTRDAARAKDAMAAAVRRAAAACRALCCSGACAVRLGSRCRLAGLLPGIGQAAGECLERARLGSRLLGFMGRLAGSDSWARLVGPCRSSQHCPNCLPGIPGGVIGPPPWPSRRLTCPGPLLARPTPSDRGHGGRGEAPHRADPEGGV